MDRELLYLDKLNNTLYQIEEELLAKAKACLIVAEKVCMLKILLLQIMKWWQPFHFLQKKRMNRAICLYKCLKYEDMITKKDYGLLLTKNIDWREAYMPVLNKPYCYMLHDLIDHSSIGSRLWDKKNPFRINLIWIDIIYTNQRAISIVEQGNTKQLV